MIARRSEAFASQGKAGGKTRLCALVISNESFPDQWAKITETSAPANEVVWTSAKAVEEALALLERNNVDIVLIDADHVGTEYCRIVRELRRSVPSVPCAVLVEVGDEDMWIDALNAGACDLVEKASLGHDLPRLVRRRRDAAVA